jgi:DNA-binding response OmpR family regulator
MKTVLIIEDDPAIVKGLEKALAEENFKVQIATDGTKGYQMAKRESIALIILDLMLPGMNGKEICQKLRAEGVSTPVLMLTAKKSEMDKVLARVKAVLRRGNQTVQSLEETTFGDVFVDFRKQEAKKGETPIALSAREFQLLKYFAEREGEVISRAKLLDDVWGYDVTPTTRTVDNYILSLRKKIETNPADPKHLLTVYTAGYKFVR